MLTGPQLTRISDALLAAYSRDELRQVMLACMDVDFLHRISPDKPYNAQVFEFVDWANRQERAVELVRCAAAGKERNDRLQQLWAEAQRWQGAESQPLPPHLRPERGGQRLQSLSAEERRRMESAYLDGLLADYAVWKEKYTPLTGVAAIKTGEEPLNLGLPDWFMPTGFEKLEEHGQGAERRVERIAVDDLRKAVAQYKRLVVLGEPGVGKTTTLWRLVYDYADAARRPQRKGFAGWLRRMYAALSAAPGDGEQAVPLPVFVPLGGYSGPESALEYASRFAGVLAPYLADYLEEGNVILLLDGMNEMPRSGYDERVKRIQRLLDSFPDAPVIVTCRVLDYVEELKLEKLTVNELDPIRQREFLHRYLGAAEGEKLFWQLAGGDAAWDRQQLEKWQRDGLPSLLALGVNPFLLVMFAQVYAGRGALPQNRGRLFAAFVDTLLERERKRREADGWPGAEALIDALAELAYAMQEAGERGTAVDRAWAAQRVSNADEMLYLAASASLIDINSGGVRFVHQLLQEYFAAAAWRRRFEAGDDLASFWPQGWIEPSGWEETAILLAGILPDMMLFIEKLTLVNPVLAARCIADSGGECALATKDSVQQTLIAFATSLTFPVKERNAAGNALNILGDSRPGVGLRKDGLPDIVWCKVPAGEFIMGSDKKTDNWARDDEMPQHRLYLPTFCIAKYPITNAQYQAFIDDGGYTEKRRKCWTEAGWQWRIRDSVSAPRYEGGDFDLPNHPVVGVSWYEAVAFCNWLTERSGRPIRLPTEAEWEKAARGTDGRRYPWGKDATPEHANYSATGIGSTSAVGVFPKGESPNGLLDASGNVWEWASSKYAKYPYNVKDDREAPEDGGYRTLRGGSWNYGVDGAHCAHRLWVNPWNRGYYAGFRVVSPGC